MGDGYVRRIGVNSLMEQLLSSVAENSLAVIILASWVTALYREKSKLMDKLLECLDDLKRENLQE